MVRKTYTRVIGETSKGKKPVVGSIKTPEGTVYYVNGKEVLLVRNTPKGRNVVVIGNPNTKQIEQAAKEYYEGMVKPAMNKILKAPPEKRLKLLEEARREMEKFNPKMLFIEEKEGEIEPLGDPVLEKKTQLGLNRGVRDVRKEFLEWVEKQEEQAKRELQKQKKKERPSKPSKIERPWGVREVRPVTAKRTSAQESFEEKKRRRIEEEKRHELSKEFADYIAKNRIMRDEIARAFDLKNSKPATIARFLLSEEFRGKILRRYEELSKGTRRFLRDLQKIEKGEA